MSKPERHSPGPWACRRGPYGYSVTSTTAGWVAGAIHWPKNAYLIASAPDLLAAVKVAIDYYCSAIGTEPNLVETLWAAYNAATREPARETEAANG